MRPAELDLYHFQDEVFRHLQFDQRKRKKHKTNVYNYLEEGTYFKLKEQGIPIAYFKSVKDQPVLPWVEGDTTIIWIENYLK
jgi:hypothetical protein